jgi:hypothetical protein
LWLSIRRRRGGRRRLLLLSHVPLGHTHLHKYLLTCAELSCSAPTHLKASYLFYGARSFCICLPPNKRTFRLVCAHDLQLVQGERELGVVRRTRGARGIYGLVKKREGSVRAAMVRKSPSLSRDRRTRQRERGGGRRVI